MTPPSLQWLAENDKIVTRYMADQEFQGTAFPILAKEIFEAIRSADEGTIRCGRRKQWRDNVFNARSLIS